MSGACPDFYTFNSIGAMMSILVLDLPPKGVLAGAGLLKSVLQQHLLNAIINSVEAKNYSEGNRELHYGIWLNHVEIKRL